ncbi:MAG: hypothetical protein R3202_02375, partial [Candidatus Competibacterales bacterium]|nr:hypothetical protein [Candidatus Competibacterales bacterium]
MLVLGMHRSGTSALSRMLNLYGLDIASRLLPASENNRRGFWESEELVALHDQLMHQFGREWHDIFPLPEKWLESETINNFRPLLLDYLERDFGHSKAFVIKDPRLCRLLPLWQSVLEEFGAQIRIVFVLRNPLEVAASLQARHGLSIPLAQGLQLWLCYNLEAEFYSRDIPRSFVSYENLLDDWKNTLKLMTKELELPFLHSDEGTDQIIDDFLSNSQRHHHADSGELEAHAAVTTPIRQAYQALRGLLANPKDSECYRTLDNLRRQMYLSMSWVTPLLSEHKKRHELARNDRQQLMQQI